MSYAALMAIMSGWLLPGSLVCIMVVMGLSLTTDDFRRLVHGRRALFIGIASMLVVPPLIGLAMALTVAPTPALAVGFILLATTPGGMLSNLFTDMAKGDLALSMSLTLLLSIIYMFVVPFYAHFAILHFLGVEAEVRVPLGAFVWDIFSITLLPAGLGFALRAWRPGFALAVKGPVKLAAMIVLFTSFGFILVDQIPTLRANLGALVWITVAINALTLLAVLALGRVLRLGREQRVAIGIEHLMRQEGTALFIAVSIVGNNEMSLPMIMNTPIALLFVLAFVALARRGVRHAPPPEAAGSVAAA
ncbi:bile acid:sodium symporter family protein [Sphingomonas baiyangensis]|nr:bile acid:sodium symporter [Sphingomonas baiyangensis]